MIATCSCNDPFRFTKVRSYLAVLLLAGGLFAVLLVQPASAVTNILVNDTWKDGNDSQPAAPQFAENNGYTGNDADADMDIESAWFRGNSGTLNPVGANGPLRGDITAATASASWTTYITPEATPVNLAVENDSIKITWNFSLTAVNATNGSQGFRIALVDSPNNRVSSDSTPGTAAYHGYAMFMNMGQTLGHSGSFQLKRRSIETEGLLGASGAWSTSLANGAAQNAHGYDAATPYSFTWQITRNSGPNLTSGDSDDGLDHVVRMSGGTLGNTATDTDNTAEVVFTDATPVDAGSSAFGSFTYDTFQIRPSGGGTGMTNALTADIFDTSLFKVEYTTSSAPPVLLGDFNGDNKVDAADYVVLRDGNHPQADFDAWRSHFGDVAGSAAGSGLGSAGAVPEPSTLLLVLAAATGALSVRRRRYEAN